MNRVILFILVFGVSFPLAQLSGQTQRAPFPRRPIGTLAETGMSSGSSRRVTLATHFETTPVDSAPTNTAATEPPATIMSRPSMLKPMIAVEPAPEIIPSTKVETVAARDPAPLSSQMVRTMALRTKLSAPESTMIKQSTQVQIEVTNDGLESSDPAVLRVRLPDHIRFEGSEPAATSCHDGVHEFAMDALASKASSTIVLQVLPLTCDSMQVHTEIVTVSRQAIGIQVARPRLDVQVSAPAQSYQNSTTSFSIQIRNPSPIDLTGIRIDAAIPEGMEIVSTGRQASQGSANKTLSWTLDSLSGGQTETIECSAIARQPGMQQCQITVTSDEAEKVCVQTATTVSARSNLKIDMCCENGQVQVGQTAELTIVLENRGTDVARDVVLQIDLPAGLRAIPCDDYQMDAGRLMFQNMEIAPGETRTHCVKCTGAGAGEHVVRAQFKSATQRAIGVEDTVFVYDASGCPTDSLGASSSSN